MFLVPDLICIVSKANNVQFECIKVPKKKLNSPQVIYLQPFSLMEPACIHHSLWHCVDRAGAFVVYHDTSPVSCILFNLLDIRRCPNHTLIVDEIYIAVSLKVQP
jgi:hypothetical protein